jgi:archaellum biogenesis ATPase FlaH
MSIAGNGSARGRKSGSRSAVVLPADLGRKGRNEIAAPLAPVDPLLMALADVASRKVQWLFPDLIPLGNITVLDGQKGEGKSALAYDLAARITAGKPIPFCDSDPVGGGAILLQAEDDLGATVKASIEAAGGDPKRIRVHTKAEPLYLDSREDLAKIRQAAEEIDARLLVADPFSEFFSKSLKDEKTIRNSFRLLRGLAADLHMAAILVRHFTKSGTTALYRGLGGVAVVNAARSALVVGHDPSSDDPYRHVLALNRTSTCVSSAAGSIGFVAPSPSYARTTRR